MSDKKIKEEECADRITNAEQEMTSLLPRDQEIKANMLLFKSKNLMKYTNSLKTWSRRNSLWPMMFGLACCAMELMDFGAARIDAERKGYLLFRGTPRQCDVMIVAGWVTKSIAPRIKRVYEQMSSPKYVIAYGECAVCGGPWFESKRKENGRNNANKNEIIKIR